MIISSSYRQHYKLCETFLCEHLTINKEDLQSYIYELFDTPNLHEFYNDLLKSATVSEESVAICDTEEFLHIIDHYDDYIHEEKRDKTGSYYTPSSIIQLMIDEVFLQDGFRKKISEHAPILTLEPSCGTMVFARAFVRKIREERLDGDYTKKLIEGLYLVDIQAEPLILGILGMIYTIYPIRKAFDVTFKVRCCDALMMRDLDNTMDLVIGNPPYLGEKGNGELFRQLRQEEHLSKYYEGRMDLYYFFIHLAVDVLKEKGLLSFITTNYFITADSAKGLRKRLRKELTFKQVTDYLGDGFFKSARGQHNVSFVLQKSILSSTCKLLSVQQNKFGDLRKGETIEVLESRLYDAKGNISLTRDQRTYDLLEKIITQATGELNDCFDVKQGIVSGADTVSKSMLEKKLKLSAHQKIEKGDPIFVFNRKSPGNFSGPWKAFYKNSDISKYKIKDEAKYLIYYVNEEHLPSAEGLRHLEQFKTVLEQRREVLLGYRKWFELQWPRSTELFEQAKLVMPQRSKVNTFAFVSSDFYGSADIYYIIHESKDLNALHYLNGVINSKLYYFWLYHRGKRKGHLLELYSTPIKNLPMIHYEGLEWQDSIIAFVKDMLAANLDEIEEKSLVQKIDSLLYEGFCLRDEEINTVENLYKKQLKGHDE